MQPSGYGALDYKLLPILFPLPAPRCQLRLPYFRGWFYLNDQPGVNSLIVGLGLSAIDLVVQGRVFGVTTLGTPFPPLLPSSSSPTPHGDIQRGDL